MSRQTRVCREKLTVVATKDSTLLSRQKAYLQKSYLWQVLPMIIYLGQLASLQPSELTCFWSSELTGIFSVEWIDISMVGWVDVFIGGWVDIGELVSFLLW